VSGSTKECPPPESPKEDEQHASTDGEAVHRECDSRDLFQDCYREIFALVESDTDPRFRPGAAKAKAPFRNAPEEGTAISLPGKLEPPPGRPGQATANRPDPAIVKKWNEKALSALNLGAETDFFRSENSSSWPTQRQGCRRGVVWLHQPEATTGKITMTKKGGAFGPGSITTEGVRDQDAFAKGVATFSKKAVEYA
jgi:hypothetical protein